LFFNLIFVNPFQFKDKPTFKPGYPMVSGCQENGDRPLKRENPHKYLLYKPTLSQVLVFLASGFKELPPNGALMLYISADGCFCNSKHAEDSKLIFTSPL